MYSIHSINVTTICENTYQFNFKLKLKLYCQLVSALVGICIVNKNTLSTINSTINSIIKKMI